jgi:hypothetical protein
MSGFWNDDTSQYFSVLRPEEFDAAMEAASADGTLDQWTWAQLLGKIPPPGYDWTGRKTDTSALA